MKFTLTIPDFSLVLEFLKTVPLELYGMYLLCVFVSLAPLMLYSNDFKKGWRGWQLLLMAFFWPIILFVCLIVITWGFLTHKFDGTDTY